MYMSTNNEGVTGVLVDRAQVRSLKIDAAHWDSSILAIVGRLIEDYLAKPGAERERFVRSLSNAPA